MPSQAGTISCVSSMVEEIGGDETDSGAQFLYCGWLQSDQR